MRRKHLLAAALALGVGTACGEGDVTIDDLVGTWNATQFVLSNPNGIQRADFVALGGSFTLTVTANGSFTGQQTFFGQTDTFAGTVVLTGNNTMTLVDATDLTDATDLAFSLSGDRLAIASTDVVYDWDDDGVDDPADLEAVLVRQ